MDIDKILESLDFHKSNGLIPAIVQDFKNNEVLMLAYVNKESMRKSLETGMTWFYSRSREKLWNKGATSGHIQKIVETKIDCDNDTVLFIVSQKGAACHTGEKSCFYRDIEEI